MKAEQDGRLRQAVRRVLLPVGAVAIGLGGAHASTQTSSSEPTSYQNPGIVQPASEADQARYRPLVHGDFTRLDGNSAAETAPNTITHTLALLNMTDDERAKAREENPQLMLDAKTRIDANGQVIERFILTEAGHVLSTRLDPQTGQYLPYTRVNAVPIPLGETRAAGDPSGALAVSGDGSRSDVLNLMQPTLTIPKPVIYSLRRSSGVNALEQLTPGAGVTGYYVEAARVNNDQYLAVRLSVQYNPDGTDADTNIDLRDFRTNTLRPVEGAGAVGTPLYVFPSADGKTVRYIASSVWGYIQGTIDLATGQASGVENRNQQLGSLDEAFFVDKDSDGNPTYIYAENLGDLYKIDVETGSVTLFNGFTNERLYVSPNAMTRVGKYLVAAGQGYGPFNSEGVRDRVGQTVAFLDESLPVDDPKRIQTIKSGDSEGYFEINNLRPIVYGAIPGIQANRIKYYPDVGPVYTEEVFVGLDPQGNVIPVVFYPNKHAPIYRAFLPRLSKNNSSSW